MTGGRDPVAIVGLACRFPGAPSASAFWELLRSGRSAVGEVPPERWDAAAFYDSDPSAPGKMVTRLGGFLPAVDEFDAAFFHISPREAACLDPQQRLLLEVAWEALEDGGQSVDRLAGSSTSVFVGISGYDYGAAQLQDAALGDVYATTGSALSVAANRISYALDLQGPSVAVDTACSSSLVAVHLACSSIWNGESGMALAAGVNLTLNPAIAVSFSKSGFMAPDGRCKAFAAAADGYVRGEGVGVVVLKPLAKALADGDPIYAIVRGSAVNQDGRSNGLTAPSRFAQESVLRRACRSADVDPNCISYVEAHGSGTALGDPIEAAALAAVLGDGRLAGSKFAIGSVKTNVGHLEAAAGIAGLIKTSLSLRHGELPPSLNFDEPNPRIPFDELPLYVNTRLRPWPGPRPRFAGVSAFGFGGTNAHIILEEAVPTSAPARAADGRPFLVPLSARSNRSLQQLAAAYADAVAGSPCLADIAATASGRRSHHRHRLAVVASDPGELAERLREHARGTPLATVATGYRLGGSRRIAFVFSGQGSQWPGMAELASSEPIFAETLRVCERAIGRFLDAPAEQLFSQEDPRIDHVQPALFAVQVALGALWRSWGIEPEAVVGHSMGELAAAVTAGLLTVDEATRIVCTRSRLLRRISGLGAMMTVELTVEQARRAIADVPDRVAVAAQNGPRATVLAGDPSALSELGERFENDGIFHRLVRVDVAAHSPQVDALIPGLRRALGRVETSESSARFYSTVTGTELSGSQLDADYWIDNLRRPVLFAPTAGAMVEDGIDLFLEVSPHPLLAGSLAEIFESTGSQAVSIGSLRRDAPPQETLLAALGAMYAAGVDPDWERARPPGRYVALPSYRWEHERFWLDFDHRPPVPGPSPDPLGPRVEVSALPGTYVWEPTVKAPDHRIEGQEVIPGAAYLELALRAWSSLHDGEAAELEDVRFDRLLVLDSHGPVQLTLGPEGAFAFATRSERSWTAHASGRVVRAKGAAVHTALPAEVRSRCPDSLDCDALYATFAAASLEYGPTYRLIDTVALDDGEALATLRTAGAGAAVVGASLLDACLQTLGATFLAWGGELRVPTSIARVRVLRAVQPDADVYAHGWRTNPAQGDVVLMDGDGSLAVELRGVRFRELARPAERIVYDVTWEPARSRPRPSVDRGPWIVVGADRLATNVARVLSSRGEACAQVPAYGGEEYASSVVDLRDAEPEDLLATVKALPTGRRLFVVTAGARAERPKQATLWGFVRSLARERPELEATLIDVDPSEGADTAEAIVTQLLEGTESEVRLERGRASVPRLRLAALGPAQPLELPADRTFLVAGGLGALGTAVAERLVERGAENLVLLGRRGPCADHAAVLERLSSRARVTTRAVDVADRSALGATLRSLAADHPPIGGIVHAAGVLDDRLVTSIDASSLRHVLAPKVEGGWNLHRLTLEEPLDFFVLFSSAAGLLGSPGQAAYAAGSAYLDALALHRRARGLPALSIDWGPWARIGLAARLDASERLGAHGFDSIPPEQAVDLFEQVLGGTGVQAAIFRFDATRWRSSGATGSPLLEYLVASDEKGSPCQVDLRALPPGRARGRAAAVAVAEAVGAVLHLPVDGVDSQTPLRELGLESLLALELRGRLEKTFGTQLSTGFVFSHPTVDALASALADGCEEDEEPAPAPAAAAGPEALDSLPEDDLERLLLEELRAAPPRVDA